MLKCIDGEMLAEYERERNYIPEPRWLSEILDAEHLLFRQVWYNRHMNLRFEVDSGDVRIITNEEFKKLDGYHPEVVVDTVWQSALRAARKTEEEVGRDLLGPRDDFEWGMVNGKLSAIRWVLGDEWDMLDHVSRMRAKCERRPQGSRARRRVELPFHGASGLRGRGKGKAVCPIHAGRRGRQDYRDPWTGTIGPMVR